MRQEKISKLIGKSIHRTKLVLFQPFSLKRWLKFLFIAFLAGALSSGSGGGNSGRSAEQRNRKAKAQTTQEVSANTAVAGQTGVGVIQNQAPAQKPGGGLRALKGRNLAVVIIVSVWILLLILILMTWLGSRFIFIWLHAVQNNIPAIKAPFRQFRMQGNSLFQVSVLMMLCSLIFFGALGGIFIYLPFKLGLFQSTAGWTFAKVFGIFGPLVLSVLIFIFILFVLMIFFGDFVVPIMALDQSKFLPAYKRFVEIYRENRGDFWLYLGVRFGLGIITSIAEFALGIVLFIVFLIAAAIVFGIPFLLIGILFKAMPVFIILAIVMAIPAFACLILTMMSVALPFAVFYRSFSLYFLSSLNCGYIPLKLDSQP